MSLLLYPLAGLAVLAVPGLLVQLAAGIRDKLWLAALTAPVSVGVYGLAGLASGIPGLSFGIPLALAVTVLLSAIVFAVAWLCRGRTEPAPVEKPDTALLPELAGRWLPAAKIGAAVLVLGGIALAMQQWHGGLGSWDTYPQEHDTIIHMVLVAYISDTGRAAPWDLLPIDVLTGQPVSFYPSGLPLPAALTGELTGGPITGFNVMNALITGPVFVLGSAALAAAVFRRLRAGSGWTALAGGAAALIAAGLFRPGVQLLHDGGIAPNAAAMSMAPGVLAALITAGGLPGWGPGSRWLRAVVLGIGVAGVFSVHPSVAATVGLSVVVFWIVEAFTKRGREILRGQWPVLLAAGVVAALASASTLLGSASQATRTGTWAPDIPPGPFGEALSSNLKLTYGGYFDPHGIFSQLSAGVLALAGVLVIVVLRRGWGVAAMWLFWLAIVVDFKVHPRSGIGSMVGSPFYKSYVRIQSHISLFIPVLAAIALVFVAIGIVRLFGMVKKSGAFGHARRFAGPVSAVLLAAALAGYVGYASIPYEHRNAEVIASRYAKPEFTRVNDDDKRAAKFVEDHIQPGERMMNSANDGSTYAYVEDRVPVVNVVTLGSAIEPETYELLRSFRDYPTDPRIRKIVLSLNIGWVYVDSQAPGMGAGPGSPNSWYTAPVFELAPGLRNLDGLPGLSVAFRSGTVTVYKLDRAALAALPH
ncbi:DUF6541 family protein [Amycolatopsis orientalis]|uniref:DUF6541 family protein n=1 Tax=Amycolatopsis orientalis TaxID=31958 RepID=UPI00056719B8|nr:DUF6541 family protein [Amycolatopsis orientalis]